MLRKKKKPEIKRRKNIRKKSIPFPIKLEVEEIVLKGTLPNKKELELVMTIKQFNDWLKECANLKE